MSNAAVLREYLVSLGFKVDGEGEKKFNRTLGNVGSKALIVSKTILGVAAAAQAMVGIFAVQMEKMYYASKLAKSTAGNLQAVEYGASAVGVGGERMRGAIIGIASAIRANPGLTGLLNQLGVQVKGRDMSDVATDLVGQLKKMPPYIAQQYAAMFGLDPETLFLLSEGLDDLKKAQEIRKQMAADAGIDMDKAAEAGKNYANQLRQIGARLETLRDLLAIKMLPGFTAFTTLLDENLASLTRWIGKYETLGEAVSSLFDSTKNKRSGDAKSVFEWITTHKDPGSATKLMTEEEADAATSDAVYDKLNKKSAVRRKYEELMRRFGAKKYQQEEFPIMTEAEADAATDFPPEGAAPKRTAGSNAGAAALFRRLEQQYALPEGLLDRVWSKESSRGKNMLSPKGAKGHFGFMDPTAAQYGVTDPNDLAGSATGAAKMWSERIKARGGDVRAAAADYNWGMGNVEKYGLGRAPAETRDYMDSVAGPVTIHQDNKTIITGVSDPKEAAMRSSEQQRQNNADLVRNLKPKVQ